MVNVKACPRVPPSGRQAGNATSAEPVPESVGGSLEFSQSDKTRRGVSQLPDSARQFIGESMHLGGRSTGHRRPT